MIEFLLVTIAVIGALQLLVTVVVIAAIRHDAAETGSLHATVDSIRTDLVADRNRNARWQG